MASYNATNSLSPMMFKQLLKKDKQGTRAERRRSKSMEQIFEDEPNTKKAEALRNRGASALPQYNYRREQSDSGWKEISAVKSLNPVVTCLLPALSMDFVASSLLAVGATPLITEGM